MIKKRSDEIYIKFKGFMYGVKVSDFPIRNHKVILVLRSWRWLDTRTRRSFSLPLDIDFIASKTRYSKEFGDFLSTIGGIPSDLPHT